MYIVPGLIKLGLKKGEKWVSPFHEDVAKAVCLCNKQVTTREQLMEMVRIVQTIPRNQIEVITIRDLIDEYRMPYIST